MLTVAHIQGILETQCSRLQSDLEVAQDRLVSGPSPIPISWCIDLRILQLEQENKQTEHEWDLKLQKMRSQTEMTVQQLQQQLTVQEQEVHTSDTR